MQETQHKFFRWFDPDPQVAREKYETLRRKLVFWFERKGFTLDDINEFVSQTIAEAVKMVEKKPEIAGIEPEKYIFGIAKNLWQQDGIKKNKDRKKNISVEEIEAEGYEISEPTVGLDEGILNTMEMEAYKKCLRKCLRGLTRIDCRIVIRFAKEGYGYAKKFSQELDKPEQYIHVRKNRALKSLRVCVEKCLGQF
ncbi:hypothetical protein L0337_42110 [candidate division KSB1 bacterium]|nr:hypothetical protein [candidate division KSB1 bacterium]